MARGTGRKTPVLLSFLGIILFSVVSASCTGHGEFQDKIGGTEHPCLHAIFFICPFCFCCMLEKGGFLGWALSKRICQTFHVWLSICRLIDICNLQLHVFHCSHSIPGILGGTRILVFSLCPYHGGCILRPWAACVAGHGVRLIGHKQQLVDG